MKKDAIFTPALVLVAVLLFLLKATGMTAHIAISVVGLVLLIAYAVLTKKEWKIPALEILMRVFYGIALISGILLMNGVAVATAAILHKVCAVLFAVLLVVLFVNKLTGKKEA